MDQRLASTDRKPNAGFVTVAAPHEWDGIGQALRAAYRDHREPPADMARALHDLDAVD